MPTGLYLRATYPESQAHNIVTQRKKALSITWRKTHSLVIHFCEQKGQRRKQKKKKNP